MDMDMDGDAEMRNTSAALIQMTNNANSLRVAKFELAEGVRVYFSLFIPLLVILFVSSFLSGRVAESLYLTSVDFLGEYRTDFNMLSRFFSPSETSRRILRIPTRHLQNRKSRTCASLGSYEGRSYEGYRG